MNQNGKIFYTNLNRANPLLIEKWTAQVKIYKEMKNPGWELTSEKGREIMKIALVLPSLIEGISALSNHTSFECTLFLGCDIPLRAGGGLVMIHRGNIIELKADAHRKVEDAILCSAPDNIYKEIYHYI